MDLMLHVGHQGETLVLSGQGQIIRGPEAEALQAVLLHMLASHNQVVLDFSSIRRMDCAGLGILADACARAREQGKSIELCGVCRLIREMIQCTGLDKVINIQGADTRAFVAA